MLQISLKIKVSKGFRYKKQVVFDTTSPAVEVNVWELPSSIRVMRLSAGMFTVFSTVTEEDIQTVVLVSAGALSICSCSQAASFALRSI